MDDSRSICNWSKENNLLINPNKIIALLAGRFSEIEDIQESLQELTLYEGPIPLSRSTKNLGLIIDSTFTWNEHIKKIVKTVNFILYRLRYFRHLTNPPLRKHLIMSLVFPHLDYCIAAIGELSQGQYGIIQKLLNSCVRYVFDIKRRDHVTPYRLNLGWLSASNRNKYSSLTQLYTILKTSKPSYLYDNLNLYSQSRPDMRPSSRDFCIPATHCGNYEKSFFVSTVHEWNILPFHIRKSTSLAIFKNNLHSYYLLSEKRKEILMSKI